MPDFFTTREIAELTAMETSAMPSTATISRVTTQSDGQGGQTTSGTSTTSSACRVVRSKQQPREVTIGDKTTVLRLTKIYFPTGTDVRDGDTVTVSGVVFQVVTALAPQSYETARVAEVVEVS